MTLSDHILELRIWWARRRYINADAGYETDSAGRLYERLVRQRRPEVAEAIVRRFLQERGKREKS